MKTKLLLLATVLLIPLHQIRAEECVDEPCPPYDDPPAEHDNTGALGTGTDTTADIASPSGGANGTAAGKITIYKTSDSIRVYSGSALVEKIDLPSDGWTGRFTIESSQIIFQPEGRPALLCPQQANAGWFGPCEMQEPEE